MSKARRVDLSASKQKEMANYQSMPKNASDTLKRSLEWWTEQKQNAGRAVKVANTNLRKIRKEINAQSST